MKTQKNSLPPALMLQGTCSNAGKSLLATAFCRILARNGIRVLPFKAQNMSLNSFVTIEGDEIGRAQALQAEACNCIADARMNPILLKPLKDHTSQIILLGKAAGILSSKDFAHFRSNHWESIKKAYLSLAQDADVMVLEGAGSPAEINLREYDLTNMRMACFAKAQVLLTADIDRGGAFAALLGTMELLEPHEKERVYGFILNKFRGDASLLRSAITEISARTQRPFLGTIPWIPDLNLPDEDSQSIHTLTTCANTRKDRNDMQDMIDVAFIPFPHLSNASDFDPLLCEKDVSIRAITNPSDFGNPDCLILPGSRNCAKDLLFLSKTKLTPCIKNFAKRCRNENCGMLIGICGGYQMLGKSIDDPFSVEEGGSIEALSILDLATTLLRKKKTQQVNLHTLFPLTNDPIPFFGYEIHHGSTSPTANTVQAVITDSMGNCLGFGATNTKGTLAIFGTYAHGLFENDCLRKTILDKIREMKQIPTQMLTHYERKNAIDRLADCVERQIPFEKLQQILGIQ